MPTKKIPAKKAAKVAKPRVPGVKRVTIDRDEVCALLRSGVGMIETAKRIGTTFETMAQHITDDPDFSTRVRAARSAAAATFEERAEKMIADAPGPFELAKARELAIHLRWRAAKLNQGQYGEKLDVVQTTTIKDVSDSELAAKAQKLMALLTKANGSG